MGLRGREVRRGGLVVEAVCVVVAVAGRTEGAAGIVVAIVR